jgi:dTDP-4-amino-4,6-dideoxygalactose transaminase
VGSGRLEVPLVDLTRQYEEVRTEAERAVLRVLADGRYILGPEVEAFEREFAEYIGVSQATGVASGTDALYLILKALGVGPGDDVLTTAFSFIATADCIANCGARPVFADIDPHTFNIDPGSAAERLTPRTRAIVVVHLYGQPADMTELMELAGERGIPLIEDCAQCHGASYTGRRAGSLGAASAFSFFPTKPLGAAGDGGVVCTDDGKLAEAVRVLRAHGSRRKYHCDLIGVNSRLDALQAALLRIKLKRLDEWNRERREIARFYDSRLEGPVIPVVAEGRDHVYHQYTVRAAERDRLQRELARVGIGSNVYYPQPLHLQPCFAHLGYREGDLPESEKASREVLSLPMFNGMTAGEREAVRAEVNRAMKA